MDQEIFNKRWDVSYNSGDPLSMGILIYHAIRENSNFYKYKKNNDIEKMGSVIEQYIIGTSIVLKIYTLIHPDIWSEEKIIEFTKRCLELCRGLSIAKI